MLLKVFNDMVPGIRVECVCLSGAMLAKAATVLDGVSGLGESTAVCVLRGAYCVLR